MSGPSVTLRRSRSLGSAIRRAGLVAMLVAMGMSPSFGQQNVNVTIDFDDVGIETGQFIGSVVASEPGGITFGPILVDGFLPSDPMANRAIIFDSALRTGGDTDLGTPNATFGGPGVGIGGSAAGPFQNDTEQFNVLIIAENVVDADMNGLVDDPDDAIEVGSVLEFDLSQMVGPFVPQEVALLSLVTIDVEASPLTGAVRLYDAMGTLLLDRPLADAGDNGRALETFGMAGVGLVGVSRIEVQLDGSGAVDDITLRLLDQPPPPVGGGIGNQLWVPNGGTDDITVIDIDDGNIVETINSPGSTGPYGIAVDGNGFAAITFSDTNELVWFDVDRNLLSVTPTGGEPRGVAIDSNRDAWTTDFTRNTLSKYAMDGTALYAGDGMIGDPGVGTLGPAIAVPPGPKGIAVEPVSDALWVAHATVDVLANYTREGVLIRATFLDPGAEPCGIAIDRENFVWVTLPGLDRVERRASDGSLAEDWSLPMGAQPEAIIVRSVNECWVACRGNGTVVRLRPGEMPTTFTVGGTPSGIAVDWPKNFWVADASAGEVRKYLNDGTLDLTVAVGGTPDFLGDAIGMIFPNLLFPSADYDTDIVDNDNEIDNCTDPYDPMDSPNLGSGFVPSVIGLRCLTDEVDANLSWSLPDGVTYDSIEIRRDGMFVDSIAGSATSYSELGLAFGNYEYDVVAFQSMVPSAPATCPVIVGLGSLERISNLPTPPGGVFPEIFGMTTNPDPNPGQPKFYFTDAGNRVIYGTDVDFNILITFPSPFPIETPPAGISFDRNGDMGLGSMLIAGATNGDPNQVATFYEVALDGTVIRGPLTLMIAVSPATSPAAPGEPQEGGSVTLVPVDGGVAGIAISPDGGVYCVIIPENCELFGMVTDPANPLGGLLVQAAASGQHPDPGYGLNGIYIPPFTQYDENGGEVWATSPSEDGEFTIERILLDAGTATLVGDLISLETADKENTFGEIVLDGDTLAAVGLTSSSIYEFGSNSFTRGDTDKDGSVLFQDAVNTLDLTFGGGTPETPCVDAYDVDGSDNISLSDVLILLNYIFSAGPPPAGPFPDEGFDESKDGIPCY